MLLSLLFVLQASSVATPETVDLSQYSECIQKEALRLEPSREPSEIVVKGAEISCRRHKFAYRKAMLAKRGPNSVLSEKEARELIDTLIDGSETRAKEQALLEILEKRVSRHSTK